MNFLQLQKKFPNETAEMIGTKLAALHNKHTERILKSNYDLTGKDREQEIMKSVDNAFAPTKKPA